MPLREQLVGDVRLAVLVLFGAVGAVLLIACGNIGSLMLTRASARRRELAIRSAIGAGTGRLLTQLICESLMLSIAGGVLGIVLATWILSGLTTWVGSRLPIPLLSQVTIDPSVMAFAAIVTVLTTLVCGLAPAIGATGGSLVTALRDGAPSVSGSRRGRIDPAVVRDGRDRAGAHGALRRRPARPQPDGTAEREARASPRSRRCRCASRCRSGRIADSNAQHTFLHARHRQDCARCRA